ncbi:MAG: Ig-like domain-containing protein [Ignavibacteriales bacterium]|nr:Ig-like domain-containing protein [Ignavibacteriales bacterium]
MKVLQKLFLTVIIFSFGCKETIVEQVPKEFTNDLLHADLVGKVTQKASKAKVIISQVAPIDSVEINPSDGSFAFRDLRTGNYDVTIRADNYRIYQRANVMLTGGSIIYLGEVNLSTVPDLIEQHYPEDNSEIVYDWRYGRITISILFTHPMDRESVEKAFSTYPATEGIFYWGNYTQAPVNSFFADPFTDFDKSATITTFSKITSMTYHFAKKDSYTDTTYTVTIGTTAKDTSGNYLRFPLKFKFKTVQSYSTQNGIMTDPVHGDINVSPLNYNYSGITVTFPRRMDKTSVEMSTHISPQMNAIFLWPEENKLRIYTGGPFLSDTTITVTIDSTAKDKDGTKLGHIFTFSFQTAPLNIDNTYPANGQLFVSPTEPIYLTFSNYISLESAKKAFSISPSVGGTFSFGGYYPYEQLNQIKFTPTSSLKLNTKYTVTVSTKVKDMHGSNMKSEYSFSFVTRPN